MVNFCGILLKGGRESWPSGGEVRLALGQARGCDSVGGTALGERSPCWVESRAASRSSCLCKRQGKGTAQQSQRDRGTSPMLSRFGRRVGNEMQTHGAMMVLCLLLAKTAGELPGRVRVKAPSQAFRPRAAVIEVGKTVLRLTGGGYSEEEEDVLSRQRSRGDASTGAGRRILSKRLRRAAAGGSVKEVLAVLADGADPRGVDLAGFTALHLAAEQAHIDVAEVLLAKAADPDARDSMAGRSPLHVAAVRGNPVMIDLLVRAGADIEAQDDSGRTPLAVAAWEGKKTSVDALLNHSATASTRDRYGQDPVGLVEASPVVQDEQLRMEVAEMLQKGLAFQNQTSRGTEDADLGNSAVSQLDVMD